MRCKSFAMRTAVAAAVLAALGCERPREALLAEHAATIERYCLDCHNAAERAGNLSLADLSLAAIADAPAAWEEVVRKLRAGVMPPADNPRPTPRVYASLASFIEGELDRTLVPRLPPPGLRRLGRAEYANAVRDVLALDIDAAAFLPPDDYEAGSSAPLPPELLDAYLSAAGRLSRLALGRVTEPTQTTYRAPIDATQNGHVEGLPFGTRGGLAIDHVFPADGEYVIRVFPVTRGAGGRPFGDVRGEKLEVLVDGRRVALVDWDEALAAGEDEDGGPPAIDVPLALEAGPHAIGVTFPATNRAPLLDMNRPFERSRIATGGLPGLTFYPHVAAVRIDGPFAPTGAGDTPSRRAVLSCRPASEADEDACAADIAARLARRAYRGTDTPEDHADLLQFYREGHARGGFEAGIEALLQRLLSDPKFVLRLEPEPADAAPGDAFAVDDLSLASRLSFFLWRSVPDEPLLAAAEDGRLRDPDGLRAEIERMLDDGRSAALIEGFAAEWLDLDTLDAHAPAVRLFPDFDDNLRRGFRRETELLLASVLREDRSVLELLTADYTFVDERLARHYGISGVGGSRFRRVSLGPEHDHRRGLLGKGSFLAVSSLPTRTSPVLRGKWVLENLLGVSPPAPPPDVPELEPVAPDLAHNVRVTPLRRQVERHRDDPACSGCHALTDPIGLALEPFDAIGRARAEDNGVPIDASAVLYDGSAVDGPAELRRFLLRYSEPYVRTVAEHLLGRALGRALTPSDMPFVRQIAREAAAEGYRFRALIRAVVESAPFRMSAKAQAAPASDEPEAPEPVPADPALER